METTINHCLPLKFVSEKKWSLNLSLQELQMNFQLISRLLKIDQVLCFFRQKQPPCSSSLSISEVHIFLLQSFYSFEFSFKDSYGYIYIYFSGFQRKSIKIEINEDGSLIMISGEKEIQETVIVGWRLQKKEKEIRILKKAFKIPDGVILDRIRAKFDEDESILTISMPKKEEGIRGVSVEEVTTVPELAREVGSSERLQIHDHHHQEEVVEERMQDVHEAEQRTEKDDHGEKEEIKADKEREKEEEEEEVDGPAMEEEKGKFKICTPIVAAGSAILLSIVVFVIQFIRTKSQPGKRKD